MSTVTHLNNLHYSFINHYHRTLSGPCFKASAYDAQSHSLFNTATIKQLLAEKSCDVPHCLQQGSEIVAKQEPSLFEGLKGESNCHIDVQKA